MTIAQPFDLHYWLVNVFAGNIQLFMVIALAFIAAMAAYFRMPNEITLIVLSLFVIMLSTYFPSLFILVIIILALYIGYVTSRLVK